MQKCQYRIEQQGMFPESVSCPHCNEKLNPIGPLWLGSIQHDETLVQMQEQLDTMELGTKKDLSKLIDLCRKELPTSSHYDYHRLAKIVGCSPPDINAVIGPYYCFRISRDTDAFLRLRDQNRSAA